MKRELGYLAMLGIATGLLTGSQANLEGAQENSLDIQQMIAKPHCKGAGGCGGLTAYRDKHTADRDDDLNDDDDDRDSDDDDDDAEEGKKKPVHKAPVK